MLHHVRWLVLLLAFGLAPSFAGAEQVRFRFVPVDAAATMSQVPVGPEGSLGELKRGLGLRALPYPNIVRTNNLVTFRHPFTCRNATVPLRLPEGTPRMEHQSNAILYNYGDYTVQVLFFPDGSIDVIYNSGLLRPLPF